MSPVRGAALVLGMSAVFATALQGQSGGSAAACSVLSVQEIKTLLGERTPKYLDMVPPNGETMNGGGSECFVGTITFQLDVVPVRAFTSNMQAYADRTTYERVTGVGDEAYFYEQDAGKSSNVVGIYTRSGQHVLVASMDVTPGETAAALRPSVTTLAKAAAAKLR